MVNRPLAGLVLSGLVALPFAAWSLELAVPAQYPTIQSAVDAAPHGATVRVAPGHYRENLVILKPLTLVSSGGAAQTVIDGGALGAVVRMHGSGGEKVTVTGFRITNGRSVLSGAAPGSGFGGGLFADAVDATVTDNIVSGNAGCYGSGIAGRSATLRVERNVIADNLQDPSCRGADGGGLFMVGDGAQRSTIAGNTVSGNRVGGYGGGMALTGVAGVVISANVFRDNRAGDFGGGLFVNLSSADVKSNLFDANAATGYGGGATFIAGDAANDIRVTANLFKDNEAADGAAVLLIPAVARGLRFVENAATGHAASSLVRCESVPYIVQKSNQLLNDAGPAIGGNCLVGRQATPA